MLPMPTALMTGSDPARVVSSATLALLLEQRRVRRAFVQVMIDHLHNESPARRCRFLLYDCHVRCSRPIP
jgi:hypothetical protein